MSGPRAANQHCCCGGATNRRTGRASRRRGRTRKPAVKVQLAEQGSTFCSPRSSSWAHCGTRSRSGRSRRIAAVASDAAASSCRCCCCCWTQSDCSHAKLPVVVTAGLSQFANRAGRQPPNCESSLLAAMRPHQSHSRRRIAANFRNLPTSSLLAGSNPVQPHDEPPEHESGRTDRPPDTMPTQLGDETIQTSAANEQCK